MAQGAVPEAYKGLTAAGRALGEGGVTAGEKMAAYGQALGGAAEQTGEQAGHYLRDVPGVSQTADWAKSVPGALWNVGWQGGGDVASALFGSPVEPTAQLGPATLQYLKQQQVNKEKAQKAADAQGQKDLAGKPGMYGAGGLSAQEAMMKTVPTTTTPEQDVEALLKPYMDQLTDLGPEYQKEMDFLTPYMSPNQGGLAPAPAYTGPDAAVVNKSQAALNQADQAVMNAYTNMPKPNFAGAAADAGGYEKSILTQAPIQAALNYQRYLQTYGGMPASTSGWDPATASAYNAILSSGGTTASGLPSPASAGAAQNANTLLNTAGSQQTTTPGG